MLELLLSCCYIRISAFSCSCIIAVGKLDWQLVLLERAKQQQRVRAPGQGLTHQERMKRRGGEERKESDMGGSGLDH